MILNLIYPVLPAVASLTIIAKVLVRSVLGYRQNESKIFRMLTLVCGVGITTTFWIDSTIPVNYGATITSYTYDYSLSSANAWLLASHCFFSEMSSCFSFSGYAAPYLLAEIFLFVSNPQNEPPDKLSPVLVTSWAIRVSLLLFLFILAVISRVQNPKHIRLQEPDPQLRKVDECIQNCIRKIHEDPYCIDSSGLEDSRNGESEERLINWRAELTEPLMRFFPTYSSHLNIRSNKFIWAGIGFFLIVERALAILVPFQVGRVVDARHSEVVPYKDLFFLGLLWLLDSSVIPLLQECSWSLLEQSYYLNTVTSLFDHVMELPKEIHEELDRCKFGDLESQGLAVSNAVRTFLFHILPVIFDLLVACIVMCYVSSTTTASDFALTVSILIFFCRHVSFCRLRILLLLPDFTRIEEATFWEAISSRQAEVCPEFLSHSRSIISDAAKKRIGVASCVCFVRAFTTIFWFVLLGIGFILVLPVTSVPCAQNQQSLGRLVALVYYILRLFQPLQSLPDTICDFIRWSIEAYRVAARLDPKAKTLNQQKPNTPIAATGKMNPKLPAYRTSTTGEANPESPVSPIIPEAKSEDETSSLVAGTG